MVPSAAAALVPRGRDKLPTVAVSESWADDELADALRRACRAQTGDPGAAVRGLRPLGGHAGFTFGFELAHAGGVEALALRVAPPGVRLEGTADVLRQAHALRALAGRVAVPEVRWSGDGEGTFGRPYMVTAMVEGTALEVLPGGARPGDARLPRGALAAEVGRAMASLHALDWREVLPAWGPPLALAEDITRWDRFLARAAEPALVRDAGELRQRLLAVVPAETRMGIFHGDFQWTNLFFDRAGLVALLDWELAGVGATTTDLGWLLLFSDGDAWAPGLLRLEGVPSPSALRAAYEDAAGAATRDLDFFRALAAYKFAVIAAFNLRLHRTGRRPDAFWEELAPSIPVLLRHGLGLPAR
jgi:aminoglycoside phosphotransferase (APT) family kinase protein